MLSVFEIAGDTVFADSVAVALSLANPPSLALAGSLLVAARSARPGKNSFPNSRPEETAHDDEELEEVRKFSMQAHRKTQVRMKQIPASGLNTGHIKPPPSVSIVSEPGGF